jgi:hypothetical protein
MLMSRTTRRHRKQSGFTILEAMIAIVILSFGILSLAAVYAQGIQVANMTQLDYIAEKKAGTGGSSDGVFVVGPQPLLAAGPDGLYGTADDDNTNPVTVIIGPGADKILGTADDIVMSLKNMTRTIAIADVAGESGLRQITITMTYTVGSMTRQYTLVSYVAQFS